MIYYDVTQLVHWDGYLAGIPRVMYELAIRFEKYKDFEVTFVSWVKELEAYVAVDLHDSLGSDISYLKNRQTKTSRTTRSIFSLSKRVALAGIRRVGKITPKMSATLEKQGRRAIFSNAVRINAKKDDVIFIPWGEWWDERFLVMLENAMELGVNVVPLIHDVGPMVQPQLSGHSTDSLSEYCKRIVPISKLVITISDLTKRDLTAWLKENRCKIPEIKIFREGDDFAYSGSVKPTDEQFESSGLKGNDYILFVSTIELKKNHMQVYYAYKLALSKGIKIPKILIVGRVGWMSESFVELVTKDPETKDNILLLNKVSDEELSWLFSNCMFTIQSSFYEGWGITVAESLARGVPAIAADTSAMVEIAPGTVKLFSPYSTDSLLSAIIDWSQPEHLKAARKKTQGYKPTSWDQSYVQIATHIKEFYN